jgi:hypothetical protein
MFVIFVFKEKWTIVSLPSVIISFSVILFTVILAGLNLFLTRFLSKDNLQKCVDIEQADNSFLPSFIGYFVIGLSANLIQELIFVWIVIALLLFIARYQYFNAIYMLFGYHYYHVTTEKGTKIFIICCKEIRNPDNIVFDNLRRINDTTYIERRK